MGDPDGEPAGQLGLQLAVDLAEASVKARSGPPGDGDAVAAGDRRWAGVVGLATRVTGVTTCSPSPPRWSRTG